jgi:hypothetical protein
MADAKQAGRNCEPDTMMTDEIKAAMTALFDIVFIRPTF